MNIEEREKFDQALLALVLKEATKEHPVVNRSVLQNLMYFVKITGVPLQYHFDISPWQRLSYEVIRDMHWLSMCNVVVTSENVDDVVFSPGKEIAQWLSSYHGLIADYVPRVEEIVHQLASKNEQDLELCAALDYLYRKTQARGIKKEYKTQVICELIDKKSDMKQDRAESLYDAMTEIGILSK